MNAAATAPPSRSHGRFQELAVPWLAAVVALLAYGNSLHYYFAQDSFTLLARARGLAEGPGWAWRLLSYDVYFRLMDSLFGMNPLPYRVVALSLHATNSALACLLARRVGLGPGPALIAGVLFAAHYAHFDALFAVASIGELMAAGLVLAALLAALPPDGPAARWRSWAVALCYTAALLSKETVVFLPLLLWLLPRLWPNAARRAWLPCAAIGAFYLVFFWATDPFGVHAAGAERNPYRFSADPSLLLTWPTYLNWALRTVGLRANDLYDGVASHPEGWAFTVGLVALLAALTARARAVTRREDTAGAGREEFRAAAFGAAHYAVFIAPVLPLAKHAYHYYLYLPVIGLAYLLAAAVQAWTPLRLRWLPWALAGLIAVQGVTLVHGMTGVPLGETGMPFLGSLRRAQTAKRVLETLPAGNASLPARVEMLGPDALSPPTRPDTTALGAYLFNDLAAALDEGSGIRLRFHEVRQVQFFGDLGPWITQPDVVVFDYQGVVKRGPTAWLYLRRAEVEWQAGRIAGALEALARAEEFTRRWASEVTAGPWRERGLEGVRRQALAMLQMEAGRAYGRGDPRRSARGEYSLRLARCVTLAR